MTEAVIAYLHFAAIITIGASLVVQLTRCHQDMQPPDIRVLARIDIVYALAAVVALATGFSRVFLVGKGFAFYSHNPVFYIKIALFIALGLLSIPPTLQFRRWHRALMSGEGRILNGDQIKATRSFILAEVHLYFLIPLVAVLMARGIGTQAVHP